MSILGIGILSMIGAVVAVGYALLTRDDSVVEILEREEAVTPTPVLTAIDKGMSQLNWRPFSDQDLANAGIKASVVSVVAAALVGSAAALLLTMLLQLGFIIGLVAVVIPPILVKLGVSMRAEKRREAFANQIPEAMTMLASALKSGMNVASALADVASEMEAPMGEELARVVNESRLGRDVVVAMRDAADRMDNDDLRWVSDALAIQRQSGGRLSELLEKVNESVAERHELRVKLKALSAEARMSGYVLMALPLIAAAMFAFVNPAFMAPLIKTGTGHLLLVGAVVLWGLGGIWMKSMAKVRL